MTNQQQKNTPKPPTSFPNQAQEKISNTVTFSQRAIIKRTIQVGSSTLISRVFGIIREVLMIRYLGVSDLSDAFLTAYKIPNSLRKIFAEGALSAAFIPTIAVTLQKNDRKSIAGLMSLSFLIFEGMVLGICMLIIYQAEPIIHFIAPGFSDKQIFDTVSMLYILIPFVFFISSSALLAGALQVIGHFFTSAIAPIVVNIIFITGICTSLFFHLPVSYLCWFIIGAGCVHFLLHLSMYFKSQFSFAKITSKDFSIIAQIIGKFLLCLPSISLMEITLFIDTSFASLLAPGSLSLIFYANRFVGIPLGVFAVAFSSILLPHFSHISTSNPKRLHFYVLESAQFILWVTLPVIVLMTFFSQEIFSTIFLSKNFTMIHAQEASSILRAFLVGLFFFSLNKILLSIFYAMHAAWVPAFIALITAGINIFLNTIFIAPLQAMGLALATTIAAIAQTILFLFVLYKKYDFRIHLYPFITFSLKYCLQLTIFSSFFWCIYSLCHLFFTHISPTTNSFFIQNIGLWLWVGPLGLLFMLSLYYSRKLFGIQLYFLR